MSSKKNADKLVDRFRRKIEEFVKASMQDDGFKDTRTSHFMLVKDMSLAADDQDRYPMGKAGQQTIRPDQIETHFSAENASPEAVAATILGSITAARLARHGRHVDTGLYRRYGRPEHDGRGNDAVEEKSRNAR